MATIISHPQEWKTGVRMLLLKGRNKDGADPRKTIMRVSHGDDQFDRLAGELFAIMNDGDRVYFSAGSRDIQRAARIFRERQLASEYDDDPMRFYRHIFTRWTSALMSPQAQADKRWLFDCDTEEDASIVRGELTQFYDRPEPPYWYESKSGQHAVVQPFNKALLSNATRSLLHDNAIMLLAY